MSRFLASLFLTLLLAACATPTPTPTASAVPPTWTPTATPTASATATLTPSATPSPSATATPLPSPTPSPTATPVPPPSDLWLGPSDLRVHPDGEHYYSGDLISFQVYAHHGYDWEPSDLPNVDVEIWSGAPGEGELIAGDEVRFYGDPDGEAWLEWVWDTTGLEGTQTLSVVLDPDDEIQIGDENQDNNLVTRTLELLPRDDLPALWADARWVQNESACCVFYYISGTPAERDIEFLMALADEAIGYAAEQLDEEMGKARLDVFLIDRVLGHGGFASDGLVLSYLDRFYAGGALTQVFRHEGTHVLDRRFAQARTPLLTEGLAVRVAGGHFREEAVTERAAALLDLDRYIPLSELADDFYRSQHEIGYLEAAAFVDFLIERYGWEAFKAFYGDLQEQEGGEAAKIDAALQEHFDLTLRQAEHAWLTTLRALPESVTQMTDLGLTVEFYDTVRRYQQAWDPSAYFLQAWLPPLTEAKDRGITADFVRHPTAQVNVTLETMFIAADQAIDQRAYAQAEALLAAINTTLDAEGDLMSDPLTAQYAALVQATAKAGYEAQRIDLNGDTAHVLASVGEGATTVKLTFGRRAGTWYLLSSN